MTDICQSQALNWRYETCGLDRATSPQQVRKVFNMRYRQNRGYDKAKNVIVEEIKGQNNKLERV